MSRRFRELLKNSDHCLLGPGVFDGISTRLASSHPFDFLYLTGAGATASLGGTPDLSVLTSTEFTSLAHMISFLCPHPVIADADTGFGGPLNIKRTIQLYESSGVAGVHIEDQTFPKRCGQLDGKSVEPLEIFLERIHSAVEARRDPDFVIIARTDARNAVEFGGREAGREAFLEGKRRLKAALEAGADVAFMESPRSIDECRELVRDLAPHPVMVNILPNGLTPGLTVKECTDLGFKMVIFPCTGFIPAMLAMKRSYEKLWEKGTDLQECQSWEIQGFFEVMGLKEMWEFDKKVVEKAEKEIHRKYPEKEGARKEGKEEK